MYTFNVLFLDVPLCFNKETNLYIECFRNIFRDSYIVNAFEYGDIVNGVVSVDDINIIFCSDFGYTNYNEIFDDIIKVSFTIEDCIPNLNYVDYSISTYPDTMFGRNYTMPPIMYYMPMYMQMDSSLEEQYKEYDSDSLWERKFASCVMSSDTFVDNRRISIFNDISTYKKVYAPGRIGNNCKFSDFIDKADDKNVLLEKRNFLKEFKFNLALENTISPNYLTEKIGDAFYSMTIPIYNGDSICHKMFNSNAFIDVTNMSKDEMIDAIREIDEDKNKYLDMLFAKKVNLHYTDFLNGLYDFLIGILKNPEKKMIRYGTHKRFMKEIYILWKRYGHEVSNEKVLINLIN